MHIRACAIQGGDLIIYLSCAHRYKTVPGCELLRPSQRSPIPNFYLAGASSTLAAWSRLTPVLPLLLLRPSR